MIQIVAVIVLAVGVYTVAPSEETARFFKLDSPADVQSVEVVKDTTPKPERHTEAVTASQEKRPKPPSPKPEPKQCREDQWVRADNGECLDKPKVEAPSETVAVEATPEPAPARVASSGGCELAYNYDWPAQTAYGICMAESTGNANAANWNDHHGSCSGSFSLMQVGCFWYPYYGYSSADYYNPSVNMEIAYKIWQRQGGFGAWTTYTAGLHLRYQ